LRLTIVLEKAIGSSRTQETLTRAKEESAGNSKVQETQVTVLEEKKRVPPETVLASENPSHR
jgi:hypothetical protein